MVGVRHRVRLPLGALVIALVAAAPSAFAQTDGAFVATVEVTAEQPSDPLIPITGTATIPVATTITCAPGSIYPGPQPPAVQWVESSPAPFVVVTMSPTVAHMTMTADQCAAGGAETLGTTVTLQATKDAPFPSSVGIAVNASVMQHTGEDIIDQAIGHYFHHQVRLEKTIWKVGQGERFSVPVTATNDGNGAVLFGMVLANQSGSLDVTLPEPFEVAALGGTESLFIDVTSASGGGYENRRDLLAIDVTAVMAADSALLGDGEQLVATIQTQGFANDSPGPAMVPALGLAFVAIASLRRITSRAQGGPPPHSAGPPLVQ